MDQFYKQVYLDIDYTDLLFETSAAADDPTAISSSDDSVTSECHLTGYSPPNLYPHMPLLRSLRSLAQKPNPELTLCLTSNSPRHHVIKCLNHLGLPPSTFSKIVTPSPSNGFATKSDAAFYDEVLKGTPEGAEVHVIDDSPRNLELAETLLPQSTPVSTHLVTDESDLHTSLTKILECVPPDFEFDTVSYLKVSCSESRGDELVGV